MTDAQFDKPNPNPTLAAGLVLFATCFFAGSTFLAKLLGTGTLGDPMHPLQVTHGRFLFAFCAVAIVAIGRRVPPTTKNIRLHVARTTCGVVGVTLMFAAVAMIPLGDAISISFLNPVFTMLLAIPLLGESVGKWRWGAAIAAFIGAAILLRPGAGVVQPGALVALASAMIIGLEVIFLKKLSGREGPLQVVLVNNTMGVVIATLAVVWVWSQPNVLEWVALAGVGIFMVCGQGLFVNALARADSSFAAPFTYATLIFATLLDIVFFAIYPDLPSLTGAAIIIMAGLILAWRESRSGQ